MATCTRPLSWLLGANEERSHGMRPSWPDGSPHAVGRTLCHVDAACRLNGNPSVRVEGRDRGSATAGQKHGMPD